MQKMNRNKLKRQRKKEIRRKRAEEMAGHLIKSVLTDLTTKKDKAEQRAERLQKALETLVDQAKNVNPGPDTYLLSWQEALQTAEKALE